MSRSGYVDDYGCDNQWDLIRWRGAVNSAITGARGQAFLREMLEALDALPRPRLIAKRLDDGYQGVCGLGAVGWKRGVDMSRIEYNDDDHDSHVGGICATFGIPNALARELIWINDDAGYNDSDEERFNRVRRWLVWQIKDLKQEAAAIDRWADDGGPA